MNTLKNKNSSVLRRGSLIVSNRNLYADEAEEVDTHSSEEVEFSWKKSTQEMAWRVILEVEKTIDNAISKAQNKKIDTTDKKEFDDMNKLIVDKGIEYQNLNDELLQSMENKKALNAQIADLHIKNVFKLKSDLEFLQNELADYDGQRSELLLELNFLEKFMLEKNKTESLGDDERSQYFKKHPQMKVPKEYEQYAEMFSSGLLRKYNSKKIKFDKITDKIEGLKTGIDDIEKEVKIQNKNIEKKNELAELIIDAKDNERSLREKMDLIQDEVNELNKKLKKITIVDYKPSDLNYLNSMKQIISSDTFEKHIASTINKYIYKIIPTFATENLSDKNEYLSLALDYTVKHDWNKIDYKRLEKNVNKKTGEINPEESLKFYVGYGINYILELAKRDFIQYQKKNAPLVYESDSDNIKVEPQQVWVQPKPGDSPDAPRGWVNKEWKAPRVKQVEKSEFNGVDEGLKELVDESKEYLHSEIVLNKIVDEIVKAIRIVQPQDYFAGWKKDVATGKGVYVENGDFKKTIAKTIKGVVVKLGEALINKTPIDLTAYISRNINENHPSKVKSKIILNITGMDLANYLKNKLNDKIDTDSSGLGFQESDIIQNQYESIINVLERMYSKYKNVLMGLMVNKAASTSKDDVFVDPQDMIMNLKGASIKADFPDMENRVKRQMNDETGDSETLPQYNSQVCYENRHNASRYAKIINKVVLKCI